jgi:hypothetical protein
MSALTRGLGAMGRAHTVEEVEAAFATAAREILGGPCCDECDTHDATQPPATVLAEVWDPARKAWVFTRLPASDTDPS